MFGWFVDVLRSGDDAAVVDWLDKIDSGGLEQLLGSESMEFLNQLDETLDAFSQIATNRASGRTSIDEIRSALDEMTGTQADQIDQAAVAQYQEGFGVEDAPDGDVEDLADAEGLPVDNAEELSVDEINEILSQNEGMDDLSKDALRSGRNLFTHSYFSQTNPSVREAIFADAGTQGVSPEDMDLGGYNFLLSTRRSKGLDAEQNTNLVPEDAVDSADPGASIEGYPRSTVGRDAQGSDVGLGRASPYKTVPERGSTDLDKYLSLIHI